MTRCLNVNITPGGASWLHAVVQIAKDSPDAGKEAIAAAFRGHGSLKHVWVVDEDINPFDPNDVEWAVATRFQADRGLVVLDGSAVQFAGPVGASHARSEEPHGQDGDRRDRPLGHAGWAERSRRVSPGGLTNESFCDNSAYTRYCADWVLKG